MRGYERKREREREGKGETREMKKEMQIHKEKFGGSVHWSIILKITLALCQAHGQ